MINLTGGMLTGYDGLIFFGACILVSLKNGP